jgi:hypothetical protein
VDIFGSLLTCVIAKIKIRVKESLQREPTRDKKQHQWER